MATGKPRFYWDTAPLIAWITDEKRKDPAEMSGLAEVVEMVDRGKAILMISVLWRAEVLDVSLTAAQKKRLEQAFSNRSILELSIDGRVMSLASEIRNFHKASKAKATIKNVRVPDAIHLAMPSPWLGPQAMALRRMRSRVPRTSSRSESDMGGPGRGVHLSFLG